MRDSHLREILPAIFLLALTASTASAQQDVSRFELGAQFSLLTFNQPSKLVSNPIDPGFIGFAPSNLKRTEPGFGGRFTYNLTKSLAFEAEGNLFPKMDLDGPPGSRLFGRTPGGRVFQGQLGVKAG